MKYELFLMTNWKKIRTYDRTETNTT